MYIGWPQGIVLFFLMLSLGKALAKHGEFKNQKYSFWETLGDSAIMIGLLYWGGFFK